MTLFFVHFVNYIRGKTTNERFARSNRAASELDTQNGSIITAADGEALLSGGNRSKRPAKRGCWMNCKVMCCNKRIVTQEEMLQ